MMETIAAGIAAAASATSAFDTLTQGVSRLRGMISKEDPQTQKLRIELTELTEQLIAAKAAQLETKNMLLKLQEEEREREEFAVQAARYTLTRTDRGGLVYALKPEAADGEPLHDICATCFGQRKKSVLQFTGIHTLECPVCHTKAMKNDGMDYGAKTVRTPRRSHYF